MLNTFRTLSGAVSTKDFIPSLTHFAVQSGRVAAFDGRVYISAPAPELAHLPPLTVPAEALLAALEGCGEDPPTLTFDVENNRLRVTSRRFTARIPVGEAAAFPFSEASEKGAKKLNGSILSALKALRPFVGDDASRPWCSSILLRGAVAFASNNVVLAEQSLPMIFPLPSALPVFAVDELLRIGAEPRAVAVDEQALTFFLLGGVFLRAALFSEAWPDPKPPLETAFANYTPTPIPPQLLEAVGRIKPLLDPRIPVVIFDHTVIRTPEGEIFAEAQGFEGLGAGRFFLDPLTTMLSSATEADWSSGARIPWRKTGAGLSGVLLGVRSS